MAIEALVHSGCTGASQPEGATKVTFEKMEVLMETDKDIRMV